MNVGVAELALELVECRLYRLSRPIEVAGTAQPFSAPILQTAVHCTVART